MNIDFIKRLRARIASSPEGEVYMGNWLGRNNRIVSFSFHFVDNPSSYKCGTTACLAGHACLVDIRLTKQAIKTIGIDAYYDTVAARLLGIDGNMAEILFYESKWPEYYQNIIRNKSDKAAILNILDRALEENSFEFMRRA